jgi:uncharacterized protein
MNYDLTRLLNNFIEGIDIKGKLNFDDEYLKNTDIRRLSEIEIDGFISATIDDLYVLSANIKGEMILPCSITLEDVSYPFTLNIDEILSENSEHDEKYIKIINKSIDIMPIVWQNIVMEIPLKVSSPNAHRIKIEGDGWRLMTDEERNKGMDPRLDKLRDLLEEREE